MELSELHDCEKSHGKIVMIESKFGLTSCGYCHKPVDYSKWADSVGRGI